MFLERLPCQGACSLLLFPACFSPQGCSFSTNFLEPPGLCRGPAWGLQAVSVSHTHRSMTRAKGERAPSEPQLLLLVAFETLAVSCSLTCIITY